MKALRMEKLIKYIIKVFRFKSIKIRTSFEVIQLNFETKS